MHFMDLFCKGGLVKLADSMYREKVHLIYFINMNDTRKNTSALRPASATVPIARLRPAVVHRPLDGRVSASCDLPLIFRQRFCV